MTIMRCMLYVWQHPRSALDFIWTISLDLLTAMFGDVVSSGALAYLLA